MNSLYLSFLGHFILINLKVIFSFFKKNRSEYFKLFTEDTDRVA